MNQTLTQGLKRPAKLVANSGKTITQPVPEERARLDQNYHYRSMVNVVCAIMMECATFDFTLMNAQFVT